MRDHLQHSIKAGVLAAILKLIGPTSERTAGVVTSKVSEQFEAVREERLRATALVTLYAIACFCLVFLVRAYQWEIYSRVYSLSTFLALTLIAIGCLKAGYSRLTAAILSLTGCSIAVGWSLLSSGGLDNTASSWLLTMPLVGGLIGGIWGAGFGIAYSLASGGALYYFQQRYGAPPDLTPLAFQEAQKRMHQFGVLVIISLSIFSLFRQIRFSDGQLEELFLTLSSEVEARKKAEQSAEKSSQIKSEFLANMSHEIRTPMNGLVGVLELLEQGELSQKQREQLNLARNSSRNLLVIINDILDLSKIESGKLSLEHVEFDLGPMFQELESNAMVTRADKKIKLVFDINLPQSRVIGDPVRTRQILENILSNAIKFTDAGEVNLRARFEEKANDPPALDVTIADTGIGIPKAVQAKLFTPFQQAESSTTREYGGTGLGLAICKQLVDLMKGHISLDSQPGEGTTFTVHLPFEARGESSSSAERPEPQSQPDNPSIKPIKAPALLLVEDNEINIQVALAMLADCNVSIDIARNGLEALEKVEHAPGFYDLILMDCQMPKMDGYQATQELIKRYETQVPPIVAMTANAMKGDREKCLDAGMSDYITKPIMPDTLRATIQKWTHLEANE